MLGAERLGDEEDVAGRLGVDTLAADWAGVKMSEAPKRDPVDVQRCKPRTVTCRRTGTAPRTGTASLGLTAELLLSLRDAPLEDPVRLGPGEALAHLLLGGGGCGLLHLGDVSLSTGTGAGQRCGLEHRGVLAPLRFI